MGPDIFDSRLIYIFYQSFFIFQHHRCYTDREEEFTVLVQIDKTKDPDDNERVGTIKFKGPAQEILGVYDQLKPWMDDHWLPKFNLEGGKIYFMHNSQHIHRSKLPGINQVKENYADQLMTPLIIIILLILYMQLHRYINQGKYNSWEQFRRDRSYFWDIYHPDESLKQILRNAEVGPPSDKPKDPSRQESPVRYHTDKVYNALLECQNDEGKNNSILTRAKVIN